MNSGAAPCFWLIRKLSPGQMRGWRVSLLEAFCRDSRRACRQITLFTVQNGMAEVITVIISNVLNFRISWGTKITVTKTSNVMPLRLVSRVAYHFLIFQLQTTFSIFSHKLAFVLKNSYPSFSPVVFRCNGLFSVKQILLNLIFLTWCFWCMGRKSNSRFWWKEGKYILIYNEWEKKVIFLAFFFFYAQDKYNSGFLPGFFTYNYS